MPKSKIHIDKYYRKDGTPVVSHNKNVNVSSVVGSSVFHKGNSSSDFQEKKIVYPKKEIKKTPYEFQNSNQEEIIHSGWDEGNVYRHTLEGSGDIFRETSKHSDKSFIDYGYISEKIARINNQISKEESGVIHPEDTFEYSLKNNEVRFNKMVTLWEKQPVETNLQDTARRLNIAMLKGNFEEAKKLVNEIEAYFKKRGS